MELCFTKLYWMIQGGEERAQFARVFHAGL
jgi:hypothetical protein